MEGRPTTEDCRLWISAICYIDIKQEVLDVKKDRPYIDALASRINTLIGISVGNDKALDFGTIVKLWNKGSQRGGKGIKTIAFVNLVEKNIIKRRIEDSQLIGFSYSNNEFELAAPSKKDVPYILDYNWHEILLQVEEIEQYSNSNRNTSEYLTNVTFADEKKVIGRGAELENLDALLQKDEFGSVNITGIGGIGKSSFVQLYLTSAKDKYDNIAYVSDASRPESWYVSGLFQRLGVSFENFQNLEDQFDFWQKVEAAIYTMNSFSGRNLLVLDDFDPTESDGIEFLEVLRKLNSSWCLIFTSRQSIPDAYSYELFGLSQAASGELFRRICKLTDYYGLDDLLGWVGYHTLTVEVLAKVVNTSPFFSNPDMLLTQLQEGGLSEENLSEEVLLRYGQGEKRAYLIIRKAFALGKLFEDDQMTSIIKKYSCIWSNDFDFEFLNEIINGEENISARVFSSYLTRLVNSGWLSFKEEPRTFYLHKIVREVIINETQPSSDDLISVVEAFELALDKYENNYKKAVEYYFPALNLVQLFKESLNGALVGLCASLHSINRDLHIDIDSQEVILLIRPYLQSLLFPQPHLYLLFNEFVCEYFNDNGLFEEAFELLTGSINEVKGITTIPFDRQIEYKTLMSQILTNLNRFTEAETLLNEIENISINHFGIGSREYVFARLAISKFHSNTGNLNSEQRVLEDTHKMLRPIIELQSDSFKMVSCLLADSYAITGSPHVAFALWLDSSDAFIDDSGLDSANSIFRMLRFGNLSLKLGEFEEFQSIFSRLEKLESLHASDPIFGLSFGLLAENYSLFIGYKYVNNATIDEFGDVIERPHPRLLHLNLFYIEVLEAVFHKKQYSHVIQFANYLIEKVDKPLDIQTSWYNMYWVFKHCSLLMLSWDDSTFKNLKKCLKSIEESKNQLSDYRARTNHLIGLSLLRNGESELAFPYLRKAYDVYSSLYQNPNEQSFTNFALSVEIDLLEAAVRIDDHRYYEVLDLEKNFFDPYELLQSKYKLVQAQYHLMMGSYEVCLEKLEVDFSSSEFYKDNQNKLTAFVIIVESLMPLGRNEECGYYIDEIDEIFELDISRIDIEFFCEMLIEYSNTLFSLEMYTACDTVVQSLLQYIEEGHSRFAIERQKFEVFQLKGQLLVESQEYEVAKEYLKGAIEQSSEELLPLDSINRAELYYYNALANLRAGEFQEVEETLQKALNICISRGKTFLLTIKIQQAKAEYLIEVSKFQDAIKVLSQALTDVLKVVSKSDWKYADILYDLMDAEFNYGDMNLAFKYADEVIVILRELGVKEGYLISKANYVIGSYYVTVTKEFEVSLTYLSKALETSNSDKLSVHYAQINEMKGQAFIGLGDASLSRKFILEAYESYKSLYGDDSQNCTRLKHEYADCF